MKTVLVTGCNGFIGQNLVKDSIIIYESTVYPGVTDEICVPILETWSTSFVRSWSKPGNTIKKMIFFIQI